MKEWWINKLRPSPSMSDDHELFAGTFEQAVRAACEHYALKGRSATVTDPGSVYFWFRVDSTGNCEDRNTPDRRFTGTVADLGLA